MYLLKDKPDLSKELEETIERNQDSIALQKIYKFLSNPQDHLAQYFIAKIAFKNKRIKEASHLINTIPLEYINSEEKILNLYQQIQDFISHKVFQIQQNIDEIYKSNSDIEIDTLAVKIFNIYIDLEEESRAYDFLEKTSDNNKSRKLEQVNLRLFHRYNSQGKYFKTLKIAHRLLAIPKLKAVAHGFIADILFRYGKSSLAHDHIKKSIEASKNNYEIFNTLVGYAHYKEYSSGEEILEQAKYFSQNLFKELQPKNRFSFNLKRTQTTLKVGFISADFKGHALFLWIGDIFPELQKNNIEVFSYCNNDHDDITGRWQDKSNHWRDIKDLQDDEVQKIILEDQVDILIDLSGHTKGNRLGVFARRAAPIQMSWLGQAGPIGVNTMDYIVSDETLIPKEKQKFYLEKICYMPDYISVFNLKEACNLFREIKGYPKRENGFTTYGCFNNCIKVNTRSIKLWSKILKQDPGAQLYIKNHALANEDVDKYLKYKFKQEGILDRVYFEAASKTRGDYLDCYNRIDIHLDPIPVGGGTTTIDSIFMGVPVITLCGEQMSHRASSSIFTSLNHTELIAYSEEEYIKLALNLSKNEEQIAKYRHNLRNEFLKSPLVDTQKFARDFSSKLFECWQEYLSEGKIIIGEKFLDA